MMPSVSRVAGRWKNRVRADSTTRRFRSSALESNPRATLASLTKVNGPHSRAVRARISSSSFPAASGSCQRKGRSPRPSLKAASTLTHPSSQPSESSGCPAARCASTTATDRARHSAGGVLWNRACNHASPATGSRTRSMNFR